MKKSRSDDKHNLSRRDFLKGTAAGALSIAAAGVLGACASDTGATTGAVESSTAGTTAATTTAAETTTAAATTGIYTPGTYSATAQGMGEITVTMSFDENSITDVTLDLSNETENIGQVAGDDLKAALLKAQSAEIDAISGATVTTNAVKEAAANCIAQAKGESVAVPEAPVVSADGDDWLGDEPSVSDIAETIDYDVVIIGAGLSGICAARAAAEEGAKVALVEKSSSFNCRSGEYALLNGTLNKRWGRENIVDTDLVVDRLMRECTYRNKRAIIKRWAEHGHEAMDWFLAAYPDLTICDTTREVVTQEQFDKGILVPLSWPQPEHYYYRIDEFPKLPSSMEFRSRRADLQ